MAGEFNVGQHIGDYEVLSILGMGGMGKVYKVRNVISDRVEAMKILLPDLTGNQSLADRFLREIRLLATLNHPNIAALRTALTYENQLAMIMEFVEGETLANRAARAPLSTADAVNYASQVLSALSYAHKLNIIHRDIKPANMMLTPQGVVKLMDFGIARSSNDGSLTTTGTTLGSLNYMPPEQVRGEAADARSDIYSFGVSLYEMLTGKLPFQGDSQYSLMTAHLNETPPEPITLRGDLPAGLNEIVMMAIAKDPGSRFQTADAFRAALSSVEVTDLPSSHTTAVTPTPKSTGATTVVETANVPRFTTPAPPRPTPAPVRPPTPPPATVPMTPPPVNVVPPPRPSSSRGVWLALGVVLGLAVLVSAATYIPRHLGTHAAPNKPQADDDKDSDDEDSAKPGTATTTPSTGGTATGTTAAPAKPVVNLQSDQGSIKVDPNGSVSLDSPKGSIHVDAKTGAVTMNGKTVGAGKITVTPPDATPAPPTTPAPPPGPTPDEIAKVQDEADKLNVRADTVTQSVETLRKQQLASGYNLRADIASSEQRMQLYITKGNAALQAQDLQNAQKYFTMAEPEIIKLEKFLNH
jgi:eukaryotic-like serine/threonine-protein kinase